MAFLLRWSEREIDVNDVLKTANNVCSLIGFKLGNSWETYVRDLHKFGPTAILPLWNSKSLVREHKRNNWKTAFCTPLIAVQMVANPTILVTWKFMKITTLKKLLMTVLTGETKNQWTLILQLVKSKISFLAKRNKSSSQFVLKQKKCKDDPKLDSVTCAGIWVTLLQKKLILQVAISKIAWFLWTGSTPIPLF